MEKVPRSCWTRVYGVFGILRSWKLSVHLSLTHTHTHTHSSNILFQTVTVETDLQAGANHRYEVHYQSKAPEDFVYTCPDLNCCYH
jgi:hypothetical protein